MNDSFSIKGEVRGWHYPKSYIETYGIPTKMDDSYKKIDSTNTIGTGVKTRIRDILIASTSSTVNYMGYTGYFTTNASGSTENGKDGITLEDTDSAVDWTLITTIHPSDPSGNYYKQWRGMILFPNGNDYDHLKLGITWSSASTFAFSYATYNPGTISVDEGDLYVFDWKISIS